MKQFTDAEFAALNTEQIEAIAKSVVTMIASGNTIKGSDGVEYQVTVVEQPKNEYEHLVGKWVRCVDNKGGLTVFTMNRWYQVENNIQNALSLIDNDNDLNGLRGQNHKHFDLNNPLDYNPETLVGKYYKGMKILSVEIMDGDDRPYFRLNYSSAEDVWCSDITPSDVTDAPPTPEPSYKLEDIVEIVKPSYYLVNQGTTAITSKFKDRNQFPKQSQGKQVAALCQLFTLMQWANEGRERKKGESVYQPYQPYISPGEICLMQTSSSYSPIYFFDREKARKLLEANEQLFKDFLGV